MADKTSKTKKNKPNLTPDDVLDRLETLESSDGIALRKARMARAERFYKMDVYDGELDKDKAYVALPTATDTIDKMTAVLMAVPPVIAIHYAGEDDAIKQRTQRAERYLYGLAYSMNLSINRQLAVHEAMKKGEGWLKLSHNVYAAEGEPPLVLSTPQAENVYATFSPITNEPIEVIEAFERTRRSIEAEWSFEFPDRPDDDDKLEAFLDEEVKFIEYWKVDYSLETVKNPEAVEGAPDSENEIETLVERKRRVKKILHCVLVDDKEGEKKNKKRKRKEEEDDECIVIKAPCIVTGWTCLPYFEHFARTVYDNGERRGLPILYSITGGDAPSGVSGVLQTQNELNSTVMDIVGAMGGRVPYLTDDESIAEKGLDLSPRAINVTKPGRVTKPLIDKFDLSMAMNLIEALNAHVYQSGIPQVYNGQKSDLSGASIDSQGTVFQWTLASMQEQHSRAYERLFMLALAITHEMAGSEGWAVSGRGRFGEYISERIMAQDISLDDRVEVKLSNSMPKDRNAYLQMLIGLKQQNALTQLQFVDEAQKLLGNSDQSPQETLKQIVSEKMFWEGGALQIATQQMQQSPDMQPVTLAITERVKQYAGEMLPDLNSMELMQKLQQQQQMQALQQQVAMMQQQMMQMAQSGGQPMQGAPPQQQAQAQPAAPQRPTINMLGDAPIQ